MTPSPSTAPTVLAFLSGKGGVGKTMLAAATAYELSRLQPTLILDLDFFNRGLSGLLLENDSGAIVSQPPFIPGASNSDWTVSEVSNNLYTISFPDIPDAVFSCLNSVPVQQLAVSLRDWIIHLTHATGCRAIVLDCHGGPDSLSFAAATIATKSLLVSEPDRITMYGTLHFLRKISELSLDVSNVHLVFNKIIDSFTSRFLLNIYNQYLRDKFGNKPLLAMFPLENYLTKHFEHRPFVTEDFPESMLTRKTQVMLGDLLIEEAPQLVSERQRHMPRPIAFFWRRYLGRTPRIFQVDFAMALGFIALLVLIGAGIAEKFIPLRVDVDSVSLPLIVGVPIWALFAGLLSWTKQFDQRMTLYSRRGNKFLFLCCSSAVFLMWAIPIELAAYVLASMGLVEEVLRPLKYLWYTIYAVVLFVWGAQVVRAAQDIRYSRRQAEPMVRAVLAVIILAGATNVATDRGFVTNILLTDPSYSNYLDYWFEELTEEQVEEGAMDAMELNVGDRPVFGEVDGSVQWYQVRIVRDGEYTINVKADSGDPAVGLFGPDGFGYIAENDDGGQHFDARLERPLMAGRYYLGVRGFLGGSAQYWIGVAEGGTR